MAEPMVLINFVVQNGLHIGKTCVGFAWTGFSGMPRFVADWLDENIDKDAMSIEGNMVYFTNADDATMCLLRF